MEGFLKMDISTKENLRKNFDKSLASLFEKVQTSEHKPNLPYGRPMNLTPLTSSVEVMEASRWKVPQKDLIPSLHKKITKLYGELKKDIGDIESEFKKIKKLEKIKDYYIEKRKNILSENSLSEEKKSLKSKDFKQKIQHVKKGIAKIEMTVNKRVDKAREKIDSLEVIRKDFQLRMKDDKVSRISRNFIDIRDGILLCDSIVNRANERINGFVKSMEKKVDVAKVSKEMFKDKDLTIGTWVK